MQFHRVAGLFLCAILGSNHAQASLRVYPVSISFGKHNKSAELTVKQSFASPTWVDVEPVVFEMDEKGSLKELSHEQSVKAVGSAMRMIRFSPKRFLLKPGESQIVRVRASLPPDSDLQAYRVHLKFIPEETSDQSMGSGKISDKINYQLRARVAMAIPIYMGNLSNQASIEGLKVLHDNEGYKFRFDLKQKPQGIVRGNLEAFVEAKKDSSKRTLVGKVTGVASYRALREVEFDLFDNFKPFVSDKSKRLVVEYREPGEDNAKVIATSQVDL